MNPNEVKGFIKENNLAVEFIEHIGVDGTTSEQAAIAHNVRRFNSANSNCKKYE